MPLTGGKKEKMDEFTQEQLQRFRAKQSAGQAVAPTEMHPLRSLMRPPGYGSKNCTRRAKRFCWPERLPSYTIICEGCGLLLTYDVIVDFSPMGYDHRRRSCICELAQEKNDREREEADSRKKLRVRIYVNRLDSGMPGRVSNYRFRDIKTSVSPEFNRAIAVAREIAEVGYGGMLLIGPFGCGKTMIGGAALNSLLDKGIRGKFVRSSELANRLRAACNFNSTEDHAAICDEFGYVPALVYDDLGSEKLPPGEAGDWMRERFTHIWDNRSVMDPPGVTIITTNLDIEALAARLEGRIMSRILACVDKRIIRLPDSMNDFRIGNCLR